MKNIFQKILMIFVPLLAETILRILGATIRFRETGGCELSPRKKLRGNTVIYAFWHSRILPAAYYYRNKGICVLVSLNKDGEYIARVTGRLGFSSVRGSTSRGGAEAVLQLAEVVKRGRDAAVTPDGPRGPRQTAQLGIIQMAKMTGVPVVPFAFDASRKITFNSWDKTILPLPFSRGVFAWGKPITVPADSGRAEMEQKRAELETALNALQKTARKEL